MRLRWVGALILAGCALWGLGSKAQAQDYPNRPVKIIIAFSPAGAIDVLGRLIADKLSTMWGQQVIVENRPGAGGNIGAAAAAQAAPDGYTLHFGAQTLGTNVTLAPSTAFHPVTSFEPIMLVGTALEMPYSQMSQTYADMFSGRTEIWFTTAGGSLPHIRSGKVRALAVNGPTCSKLLPELPTMIEVGVPMKDESSWYGFFAPKGTPKAIIDKVNRDLQTVIDMPDMRERELALGYRFIGGPPDKLADHLKTEIAKWDDLSKKGAFKAN